MQSAESTLNCIDLSNHMSCFVKAKELIFQGVVEEYFLHNLVQTFACMHFTKKITAILGKEVQNLTSNPVTDLSSRWHAPHWLRQL